VSKFEYSQPVNLDDNHSKIFVADCLDKRFRAAFDEVAEQIAGGKNYDRAGTAGVSKAIVEGSDGGDTIRNIEVGIEKHGIEEVHLFDHIQCGLYGGEEEPEEHFEMLRRAGGIILANTPILRVHAYLFHGTHAEVVEI